MGRPKKRQRQDADNEHDAQSAPNLIPEMNQYPGPFHPQSQGPYLTPPNGSLDMGTDSFGSIPMLDNAEDYGLFNVFDPQVDPLLDLRYEMQ